MLGYRLFLMVDFVIMHLPASWRKGLFTTLSSLAHRLAFSRNTIIQNNLSFAFGDTLTTQKTIESY